MGFPVAYTQLGFPKLLIYTLSFVGFLRNLLNTLFHCLGLPTFLEPDIILPAWPEDGAPAARFPEFNQSSVSCVLARELLPVVRFSDLPDDPPPSESCAVCLAEFEGEDEIRRLTNCRHIFHMGCLDRWMGYDQLTCPLCRTPVVPDDMQESFNETLWAASGIPDFYGEYYNQISAGL
ncbi:hypothetical protein Tsubulata_008433 [Turnera subulata]|uniref:RING-type domain-containing protein n=1 Tax=Turnera subulata TaxID=218843 RepID=A0A9Q0FT52_9ROSI|nr:hypothetical protein Tsubulata_008433 [Turnera subulata]